MYATYCVMSNRFPRRRPYGFLRSLYCHIFTTSKICSNFFLCVFHFFLTGIELQKNKNNNNNKKNKTKQTNKSEFAFCFKMFEPRFHLYFQTENSHVVCFNWFLGWEWEQHIYKFIPLPWNALSWTEAKIYCKEMEGGNLLSIRTPKESRWVTDRIRQIRRVIGFSKFWIGASDFGHEGIYQWSDDNTNRPINFTRYRDTQRLITKCWPGTRRRNYY